jgi:hypothetical protein
MRGTKYYEMLKWDIVIRFFRRHLCGLRFLLGRRLMKQNVVVRLVRLLFKCIPENTNLNLSKDTRIDDAAEKLRLAVFTRSQPQRTDFP